MNKQEAKNLIIKTFENSFDEAQYTYFIKNFLINLDESKRKVYRGQYVPASFSDAVKHYKRIGQYVDSKNNVIDVLIVNLNRGTSLERARSLQRNFIARYLKQRIHDAALVAYYTDGNNDWRFSLVKMDINLNDKKIESDFTPARRYSFLVGTNEGSHTAQNQFVKLITEKEENPTLDKIEDAFNIETVTKEFFLKYRNLFILIKQALDKVIKNDSTLEAEFKAKEINSVDFSKKLLGQIVFLYFLQKKGWFGVEKNSKWGTGSKKFLRELLNKKHGDYKNFFNDILEPLFYEALRYDRQDYYYSRFNCKIPFLNGGLFDPIGNYDWVHTDIILPNELFSNSKKTDQGDTGDGIFDIFDRYNFTVIEDEPLEKEVAIDPELLGKAYEKFNAIRPDNFDDYIKALKSGKKGDENKFNKQFGVYYTPREIVHYMCRESLINYLASEFSLPAVASTLTKGSVDKSAKAGDKTDAYQKVSEGQLDAFENTACLSGEALAKTEKGQLNLEAEYKPNPYIPKEDIDILINSGELLGENEAVVVSKGKETETYSHKLPESIRRNSKLIDEKLSDILVCDPAAGSGAFPVGMMHEIVSTRNLLSIFIPVRRSDSEGGKESERTIPQSGISLRSIYKFKRDCIEKSLYGVDIDSGAVEIAKLRLWLSLVVDEDDINNIKPLPNLDYKIVCGNSLLGVEKNLFNNDLFVELEKLKPVHFNETNPTKKQDYKKQIDKLILKLSNGHKDFDYEVYFSEVFHQKKGFDVVIANPPYVRQERIEPELKQTLRHKHPKVANGTADLYVYFFSSGLRLLNSKGNLIFITLNKYLKTKYGKELRKLLKESYSVSLIIDFFEQPVFDATTDSAITLILNKNESLETKYYPVKSLTNLNLGELVNGPFSNTIMYDKEWIFIDTEKEYILDKLSRNSVTLKQFTNDKIYSGIKTAFNEAFILNNTDTKFLLNSESKSIIKKYAKSTDIKKWSLLDNSKYFLATGFDIDVKSNYPTAYKHLKQFEQQLKSRQDQGRKWFNLRACAYYDEFTKPKIIYMHTAKNHKFYLDYEGRYINNSCYMIISDNKFLFFFLNSKLFAWYIKIKFVAYGDAEEAGRVKLDYNKMVTVPILQLSNKRQKTFAKYFNKIVGIKKQNPQANTKHLEDRIDIMVYKLYNLTYEEVKIIDPEIEKIISMEEYEKFEIE